MQSTFAVLGLDKVLHIVVKAINPFEWFGNQIKDLFLKLVNEFNNFITDPHHLANQPDFYGNMWGLATVLAGFIFLLMVGVYLFRHHKLPNLAIAALNAGILGYGGGAIWYSICSWAIEFGDNLTNTLQNLPLPDSSDVVGLLFLPTPANLIGAMFGLGAISFWGFMLMATLLMFELVIVLVVGFGIIAWVMRPLGHRSQAMWDWLVALGIVAMITARPTAVLCLYFAEVAISQGGGLGMSVAFVWEFAAIVLAIILIWLEVYAAKVYSSRVFGKLNSDSHVYGKVQTEPVKKVWVDVKRVQAMFVSSIVAAAAGGTGALAATSLAHASSNGGGGDKPFTPSQILRIPPQEDQPSTSTAMALKEVGAPEPSQN